MRRGARDERAEQSRAQEKQKRRDPEGGTAATRPPAPNDAWAGGLRKFRANGIQGQEQRTQAEEAQVPVRLPLLSSVIRVPRQPCFPASPLPRPLSVLIRSLRFWTHWICLIELKQ